MNLYFRLLLVVIRAFFRSKIDLRKASSVFFHVLPSDLDLNGHMNNGRYLTIMDLGRFDLSIRTGFMQIMLKKNWRPVVASETIRFRRPLFFWQKYELKSRFLAWDHEWLFIEQVFMAGGEIVAAAYVKAVVLHKKNKIPLKEIAEALGVEKDLTSNPLPDFLKEWQQAEFHARGSYLELAAEKSLERNY